MSFFPSTLFIALLYHMIKGIGGQKLGGYFRCHVEESLYYINLFIFLLFLGPHTYISINSAVNHQKIVIFLTPHTQKIAHMIFFHLKWTFIPIIEIFKSENRKLSWGVGPPKNYSHNVCNKEKVQRLREVGTIVAI